MALRGNQTARHEDVPPFRDDPVHARMRDAFQGADGAHGRIETRRALISHDPDRPDARHDRPGPRAIGEVAAARARRAIENGPHRVPDVTMNGDRARNREEKGPGTLAIMRRAALKPGAGGKVERLHARKAQKSRMA